MLVTTHQNGISTVASAEAAGGSSPPQTERLNRGNTMLSTEATAVRVASRAVLHAAIIDV